MTSTADPSYPMVPEQFVGEHVDPAARAVFVVIGSVMILSSVVGNVTLFFVVIKHFLRHRKRHLHDLFVVSLVLDDLFIMGYWFSFFVSDIALGYHPVAGGAHCSANGIILVVLFTVNKATLVSISLNRYLHVCHSTLYHRVFTLPRTACWCTLIWLLSIFLTLPPLWGGSSRPYGYNTQTHICSYDRGLTYLRVIVILYSVLSPFCIGYFNFAIYRFWRKASMGLAVRYTLVRKDANEVKNLKVVLRTRTANATAEPAFPVSETARQQESQVQNSPESVAQNRQVVCKRFLGERDGALFKFINEKLTSLNPHRPATGTAQNEDDLTDSEVTARNSSGDQVKETVSGSVSTDSESDDDRSGDTMSGDKAQNHQERMEDCVGPKAGGDGSDSSRFLFGATVESNLYRSGQLKHIEEVTTKTETDITRGHEDILHCEPTSAADTAASASLPRPPQASARKPQRLPSSKYGKASKTREAREKAFIRSLLVVSILTFFTFEPYTVLVIVDSYIAQPVEVHIAIYLILFLNNTVSWVVYGVMNPAFKKSYLSIIRLALKTCRRAKM